VNVFFFSFFLGLDHCVFSPLKIIKKNSPHCPCWAVSRTPSRAAWLVSSCRRVSEREKRESSRALAKKINFLLTHVSPIKEVYVCIYMNIVSLSLDHVGQKS
jgi:hypothetical protein